MASKQLGTIENDRLSLPLNIVGPVEGGNLLQRERP